MIWKSCSLKGNGNIFFYCPKRKNSWNYIITSFKVFSSLSLFPRYLTSKFALVRHLGYSQLCIPASQQGSRKFLSLELEVVVTLKLHIMQTPNFQRTNNILNVFQLKMCRYRYSFRQPTLFWRHSNEVNYLKIWSKMADKSKLWRLISREQRKIWIWKILNMKDIDLCVSKCKVSSDSSQ